jgi:hypothetical protein
MDQEHTTLSLRKSTATCNNVNIKTTLLIDDQPQPPNTFSRIENGRIKMSAVPAALCGESKVKVEWSNGAQEELPLETAGAEGFPNRCFEKMGVVLNKSRKSSQYRLRTAARCFRGTTWRLNSLRMLNRTFPLRDLRNEIALGTYPNNGQLKKVEVSFTSNMCPNKKIEKTIAIRAPSPGPDQCDDPGYYTKTCTPLKYWKQKTQGNWSNTMRPYERTGRDVKPMGLDKQFTLLNPPSGESGKCIWKVRRVGNGENGWQAFTTTMPSPELQFRSHDKLEVALFRNGIKSPLVESCVLKVPGRKRLPAPRPTGGSGVTTSPPIVNCTPRSINVRSYKRSPLQLPCCNHTFTCAQGPYKRSCSFKVTAGSVEARGNVDRVKPSTNLKSLPLGSKILREHKGKTCTVKTESIN